MSSNNLQTLTAADLAAQGYDLDAIVPPAQRDSIAALAADAVDLVGAVEAFAATYSAVTDAYNAARRDAGVLTPAFAEDAVGPLSGYTALYALAADMVAALEDAGAGR